MHRERPFFAALVEFMTCGPVVAQVLEGEDAVAQEPRGDGRHQPGQRRRRHDPQGLRRESIEANSVHGSDSAGERRASEIAFFFAGIEIVG